MNENCNLYSLVAVTAVSTQTVRLCKWDVRSQARDRFTFRQLPMQASVEWNSLCSRVYVLARETRSATRVDFFEQPSPVIPMRGTNLAGGLTWELPGRVEARQLPGISPVS